MKRKQQDFILGLTTLAFAALFLGTVLFLYPLFQEPGRALTVIFPHESGMAPLKEGSAVKLGGSINVGRVTAVRTDVRENPRMPGHETTVFVVDTEIDPTLQIHGNCRITTDQPAIGGSGYLTILHLGTPDVPLEQPIIGLPPQSLSAAVGELSRRVLGEGGLLEHVDRALDPAADGSAMYKVVTILDDLNAISHELRAQMSPSQEAALLRKLHGVVEDVSATTSALRTELADGDNEALLAKVHLAVDQLGRALSEATAMLEEDRPIVRDALTSVANAARAIDTEIIGRLREELDRNRADSAISKVHAAMDSVDRSLDDLNTITSTSERLLVVSRPQLETTLQNFQGMSEQLRLASQEVLLNPSKLIWGPGGHRSEQMLVFQAARSFAEAASELDHASSRLAGLLETLPQDGTPSPVEQDELRAIHDAVRASFQRFEQAETKLWNELK